VICTVHSLVIGYTADLGKADKKIEQNISRDNIDEFGEIIR
jgi:hypothetical protein